MASARQMAVNTAELERAAAQIRDLNETYTRAYEAVFEQFQFIDAAWDGDDNKVFNEHVLSFKKDFIEMTLFFERVVSHLMLSAQAYKLTESVTKGETADLNTIEKYTNVNNPGSGHFSGGGGGGGGGGSWGGR